MASCSSVALAVVLAACKQADGKLPALDGELDEPAWNQRAIRGVFAGDDGAQARPYSEIRLLRDTSHLVVGLYAADEDIRSDDKFEVTAGPLVATLYAGNRATPASVRLAVDHDGTLDDAHDDDEEWVVEAQLPLDAIGPAPVAITASRCDRTKLGERRCGSWHGVIDPATLPAITDVH